MTVPPAGNATSAPTTFVERTHALRATPKTWLVTGAAGFIGSNLVEALLSLDQNVVGIDNFATGRRENIADLTRFAKKGFRFLEGDIRTTEICARACEGVDYVL